VNYQVFCGGNVGKNSLCDRCGEKIHPADQRCSRMIDMEIAVDAANPAPAGHLNEGWCQAWLKRYGYHTPNEGGKRLHRDLLAALPARKQHCPKCKSEEWFPGAACWHCGWEAPTPPSPTSREAVVEALDRNVGTLLHDIVTRIPRAALDHNFVGWLEESKRAVDHGLHYAANAILAAPPAREPVVAALRAMRFAYGQLEPVEGDMHRLTDGMAVMIERDLGPALWPVGQRVPATEDEMARVEAFNAGTGPAPETRGAAATLLDAAIEVCKISTSGDENDHFAESFEAPFERLRAAAEQARKETAAGQTPAWIPCPCCEDFWCTLHNMHAYECKCPPVEEWKGSPYKSGGSADRKEAAGT
jgi:hypothetical protein